MVRKFLGKWRNKIKESVINKKRLGRKSVSHYFWIVEDAVAELGSTDFISLQPINSVEVEMWILNELPISSHSLFYLIANAHNQIEIHILLRHRNEVA